VKQFGEWKDQTIRLNLIISGKLVKVLVTKINDQEKLAI